jgi:hypothetical protein
MVLTDKVAHPEDLDYLWYQKEAIKIAISVGCESFLTTEEIALVTPPPKEPKKRGKNGTR